MNPSFSPRTPLFHPPFKTQLLQIGDLLRHRARKCIIKYSLCIVGWPVIGYDPFLEIDRLTRTATRTDNESRVEDHPNRPLPLCGIARYRPPKALEKGGERSYVSNPLQDREFVQEYGF